MAGDLKPAVANLKKESGYTINGYLLDGYSISNKCQLFDEKQEPPTGYYGYWNSSSRYLDITIAHKSNIWGLSLISIYDAMHSALLTIHRMDNDEWVDVTAQIKQNSPALTPATWTKTIPDIPPGRYKFTVYGYRAEAEWYIEQVAKVSTLYVSGNTAHGIQGGVFNVLSNNWANLNDTEKVAVFNAADVDKKATLDDLKNLGKYKVSTYCDIEYGATIILKAAPKDQLVMPKGLISLDSFDGIDKATLTSTVSGNGTCKLLVTNDLTTYQTYDFITKRWKVVDHADLAAVKANSINIQQLPTIDRAAWDALTTDKAGIGFAYLLSIEDITDTCSIDKLELQVDMRGSWDKAVHGTDYKYGYPANAALRVSLLSNGDYKINYSK